MFLKPIAKKHSYQVVSGMLDIWRDSSNFSSQDMKVNESCDKMIQLLVCLNLEPHVVIDSVNRWANSLKDVPILS